MRQEYFIAGEVEYKFTTNLSSTVKIIVQLGAFKTKLLPHSRRLKFSIMSKTEDSLLLPEISGFRLLS